MEIKNKFLSPAGALMLISKPIRWTSFDVVKKIRNVLTSPLTSLRGSGEPRVHFKVGHAGTLDPLATGLLILCTGRMTKNISEIQSQEKEYTGTFMLGATTASYDLETEIIDQKDFSHVTEKMIYDSAK
ncbi:MAG: hypothetical protein JJE25_09385, partial [Bacteroidia bacterium]|nr:hypothetical protein [Bacteroidia bacterium]